VKRGAALSRCGKRWATEDAARCSKRFLSGGYGAVPCAYGCGWWHLERVTERAAPRGRAPRYTGPDELTRAVVLERDRCACVCCGVPVTGRQYSLQHRDARGMGGTRDSHSACPCNLVTMLGSAVTECHGRVEGNRDPQDEAKGYALRHGQVARFSPVMVFGQDGGATLFPTCDGQWSTAPGEAAGDG
jgi:hypothetical protein